MKLRIFSDIHLEFGKFQIPEMPTDSETTLILAGDIALGLGAKVWLEKNKIYERFANIIYVAGNHEFYGKDLPDIFRRWNTENSKYSNFHFLNNEIKIIDGVTFLGTTLWSDFKNGDPLEVFYAGTVNDFKLIRMGNRKFTVADHISMHRKAVDFLRDNLIDAKPPVVVVTHFMPSFSLVKDHWKNSPINGFYASNLDHLIPFANLWVHGHTHDPGDTMLGNTRVVCNPRGYLGHENTGYDPYLLVEV